MTNSNLETAIVFYEQVLGKEEVEKCKHLAIETVSYREAADLGTDYITLLNKTWMTYCFKAFEGML